MNYSIIDIETTGSSPINGKITEIAIFVYNGYEVIDSFETLVNPECNIPWNITRLTGITNEMVLKAPKFFEIAKKIVEITSNTIFVAHNVSFDYSYIREEFKRLGYDYKRKTLCTVKLSRKLIPGLRSYSLGNLCQELQIPLEGRHRAGGDALATVKLFEMVIQQHATFEGDLFTPRQGNISEEALAKIPGKCGVYYLFDQNRNLIYVGKSKNLHQRILAHLNNKLTQKAMDMAARIHFVDFIVTDNEIIALLLESEEIKKNKPFYNRSQRRSASGYGIFIKEDESGYLNLKIEKTTEESVPLTTFTFVQEGIEKLHQLADKHGLCKKLCNLEKTEQNCFDSKINKCNGACIGIEPVNDYNARVLEAIKPWQFHTPNFFILELSEKKDKIAVVKIQDGKYIGFGFVEADLMKRDLEILNESIKRYTDNWDTRLIIRSYLKKNYRRIKILEF